jgi:hypothetical protein
VDRQPITKGQWHEHPASNYWTITRPRSIVPLMGLSVDHLSSHSVLLFLSTHYDSFELGGWGCFWLGAWGWGPPRHVGSLCDWLWAAIQSACCGTTQYMELTMQYCT